MTSYAAFIGHQPLLSKAELAAKLPDIKFEHSFADQFITFETAEELDQEFLNTLGGTIMIAKQVEDENISLETIPQLMAKELVKAKGKVSFSLRFLGIPPAKGHDLFRSCKKYLKAQGVSSRYIGNEREPAKAIQLHDEGLLNPKEGCELTILRDEKHGWIGRTIAAQDVKAYTQRDIGKPVRDTTVGLLPPKLAQMMLNFGWFAVSKKPAKKMPKTLTVLDPFCGTGVIPMEALLRGWTVLASDKEIKAINGCRKNIEWERKTYKIFKKDVEDTIWKQDATKPFELKELPDVIVTEGTLGPSLRDRPTLKESEKMLKDAEQLEIDFLTNCKATLPGVPVVMMWPVWYTQKRPTFLEKIIKRVEDLGYTLTLPPHISPTDSERKTMLYRRPDQFVGREIAILMPR